MAKILVTGGAGYIGSHTCVELLNNKHSVVKVLHKDKYYVYALCKPNGIPFYIGKGKGSRINDHFKPSNLIVNSQKVKKIKKYGINRLCVAGLGYGGLGLMGSGFRLLCLGTTFRYPWFIWLMATYSSGYTWF